MKQIQSKIKKYGRQVKNYDYKIWNKFRYDIMINAFKYKFNKDNTKIYKILLDKNNKIIYETSHSDRIRGIKPMH